MSSTSNTNNTSSRKAVFRASKTSGADNTSTTAPTSSYGGNNGYGSDNKTGGFGNSNNSGNTGFGNNSSGFGNEKDSKQGGGINQNLPMPGLSGNANGPIGNLLKGPVGADGKLKDAALMVGIKLDLEAEVHLTARVRGDILVGLY